MEKNFEPPKDFFNDSENVTWYLRTNVTIERLVEIKQSLRKRIGTYVNIKVIDFE